MGTFRSSTSSSRAFVRDVAIVVLLLAAIEAYLVPTMAVFERRGDETSVAAPTLPENYRVLGRQDPLEFFGGLRADLADLADAPIVFVGDSQGAGAHGGGAPYPQQVAERLLTEGRRVPVVSLHLGGANAYEQSVLLLAMLREGITPCCVVWSHSIFSQRKNEVRAELAAAYRHVEDEMATLAPNVIVPATAEHTEPDDDRVRQRVAAVASGADGLVTRLATVRFMRRSLWDKGQILRRSPLGQLIPASVMAGTARQFDPPASILEDAARLVGEVSGELENRGIRVLDFVAPINREAVPRPFTARAEAVTYPALQRAAVAGGAQFLNLLDALPPSHYGRYADGTLDAFHIDSGGHAVLADTLLHTLRLAGTSGL